MANSPVLNGDNFVLRPFAEDLISARYVGWLNNKDLMKYSRQRFLTHTAETCLDFMNSFADGPNYFWGIVASAPALGHIGNITANVDVHNNVADLTIMIGETRVQGRGFGLASWSLAMSYMLTSAGCRKVSAGTMAINVPMIKIMRNSGMVEDGIRSRHFLCMGQEIDCVMYAKFASGN